jgi:hypothetical protein
MTAISKTCHQELTAHYEQLRDDALSLTTGHQPTLGLDLLLRQGMAAWIQAWSACAQKPGVEAVPPSTPRPTNSLDVRVQMASILAGVILGRPLEAMYES